MSETIEFVGKIVGGAAAVGFLVCWVIAVVNMIRLIRLQKVFSDLPKKTFSLFSISGLYSLFDLHSIFDALQGDAFGEAGRKPRKRAFWGFVGAVIFWAVGFGVLALTQRWLPAQQHSVETLPQAGQRFTLNL